LRLKAKILVYKSAK